MGMKTGYRTTTPAHYRIKLENFTLAATKIDRYDSELFEAAGHKWRLVIYPNGNVKHGGEGHISLYLALAENSSLAVGSKVRINFKMFVYDYNKDRYFIAEDDNRVWNINDIESECGFDKLISIADLNMMNGYLSDNDSCVFGVEVIEVKYIEQPGEHDAQSPVTSHPFLRGWFLNLFQKETPKKSGPIEHINDHGTGNGSLPENNSSLYGETLSTISNPEYNIYTWKLASFSLSDSRARSSEVFLIGEQKWKLTLYPKGDSVSKDQSLSLYLNMVDRITPPGRKMFVQFKLRINNQFQGYNDHEKEVSYWFSTLNNSNGVSSLISLADLNNPSKGFVCNDILTVEVEFVVMSQVKDFF